MATLFETRREQMFPKLTAAQIERLKPHGRINRTTAGQVLFEAGQGHRDMQVVLSGALETTRPGMQGETPITMVAPGEFTGEMSTLRGLGGFTRVRVVEAGEILSIPESRIAHDCADRLGDHGDFHAGVHFAPHGTGLSGAGRRCHPRRLHSFAGDAAAGAVSDS